MGHSSDSSKRLPAGRFHVAEDVGIGNRLPLAAGGRPVGVPASRERIRPSSKRSPSAVVCLLTAECVPELYEIEIECNRPIWSPQLLANEFRNAHARVYGARLSGRIVGFLIVHVILDEAHILNFGIKSSFRGEGVGRVLLVEVIDRLIEEGVHVVTLEVRATNSVARSLYESIGFAEAGIRPHYYTDNGEDALILRLDAQHFLVTKR
jgi:ribosomal-protein-alanine N-acetyltransferase